MPVRYIPDRGDIVWLEFDPQAGHEQAGHRPEAVLSPRAYNQKSGLALCCPITSRMKGYPFEVILPNGLPSPEPSSATRRRASIGQRATQSSPPNSRPLRSKKSSPSSPRCCAKVVLFLRDELTELQLDEPARLHREHRCRDPRSVWLQLEPTRVRQDDDCDSAAT